VIYQEFYRGMPTLLPLLAMFIFLVTFTVVLLRALLQRKDSHTLEIQAQLPLIDDERSAS
jgi:hypothetical protein